MERLLKMNQEEDPLIIESRIRFLSKIFNTSAIITILMTFVFTMTIFLNGRSIQTTFIFKVFERIPYIGQVLHLWIRSLNLVNFNVVYQKLFMPLLSLELLYYSIFIVLLQGIMLFLKRGYMKGEKQYFRLVMVLIIGLAIIFGKQITLLIIPVAQNSYLNYSNLFITLLITIQIISILAIAINQSKLGQFDAKELYNEKLTSRLFKIGSIGLVVLLLIQSSALFGMNYAVDIVQEQVAFDYVVDFRPVADGTVQVDLPSRLIENAALIGITLPKTIEGGEILEQFATTEVNLGAVLTHFIIDNINIYRDSFISEPLYHSLITLAMLGLLIIFNKKQARIPFNTLVKEGAKVALTLIIAISVLRNIGMINSIFALMVLYASISTLYQTYRLTSSIKVAKV